MASKKCGQRGLAALGKPPWRQVSQQAAPLSNHGDLCANLASKLHGERVPLG